MGDHEHSNKDLTSLSDEQLAGESRLLQIQTFLVKGSNEETCPASELTQPKEVRFPY